QGIRRIREGKRPETELYACGSWLNFIQLWLILQLDYWREAHVDTLQWSRRGHERLARRPGRLHVRRGNRQFRASRGEWHDQAMCHWIGVSQSQAPHRAHP